MTKEEKAEYDKEYYRLNKEKKAQYTAQYQKEHPEKIREISRRYRKRHPERARENSRKSRNKRQKDKVTVSSYLISKYSNIPCMDCSGIFPFCAMDFDHRPEELKSFGIATMNDLNITSERISKIEKEISKCDLVCATCHRIRTYIKRCSN